MAEIERLNNLIAEANKFRGEVIHAVTHIDKIKAEAYKEFAYALKSIPRNAVYKNEIDRILEERLGECNAE